MSLQTKVAKRYAKALLEVAAERDALVRILDDIRTVQSVIGDNPELLKFLNHPKLDEDAKLDMIRRVFEAGIGQEVYNTLVLLVKRGRAEYIPLVADEFKKIANKAMGIETALVYTPRPLTEQESAKVAEQFARLTGKTVEVESVLDDSLIGGIKVRIGDRIYDGSISGKLNRMLKTIQASDAL